MVLEPRVALHCDLASDDIIDRFDRHPSLAWNKIARSLNIVRPILEDLDYYG